MTTENVISQFNKYLLDKGIEGNEAIIKAAYAVLNGGKPAKAGGEAWWLGKFKDVDSFVTDFIEIAKTQDVANKWATDYENGVTEKTVAEISALFAEYVSANNITDQAEIVKAAYVVLGGDRTPIAGGVDWWVGQKLSVEDLAAKFIATARTKSEASAWANDFESGVPGEPGEPGEPSNLTEALEALQQAQADRAEFLKDAAEIDAVKAEAAVTTEGKIADAVTAADAVLVDTGGTSTFGSVYAAADTEGVKAAKLADKQAGLATALETANKNLNTSKEEVAKVSGLKSAIELYDARVAAQEGTAETLLSAQASVASLVAAYNVQHSLATITPDATTGLVAGVIVANATTGRLELATGVTETTHAGIGAVLTALQARVDALAADDAAKTAIEAAVIAVGYIDAATTAKDTIAVAIDALKNAAGDGDTLTQSQIAAEVNKLKGLAEGALTAADPSVTIAYDATSGVITTADFSAGDTGVKDAFDAAKAAFNTLKTAVNTFEGTLTPTTTPGGLDYTFATAAKTTDQVAKQGAVDAAQKAITDLAEALSELNDIKQVAADLKDLDDAIKAAEDAFEELGVEAPVSVEGVVVGTAENDVFLYAEKAGNIVNFDAQGDDVLFVGNKFNLVTLTAEQTITQRVGDAAEWEIFAKQNGANVDLYVEQQTFAGNGINETDIVKITLSGVNVADLQLEDGFISIA